MRYRIRKWIAWVLAMLMMVGYMPTEMPASASTSVIDYSNVVQLPWKTLLPKTTEGETAAQTEETAEPEGETADQTEETAEPKGETADQTEETAESEGETADQTEETAEPKGETADQTEETAEPEGETADQTEETAEPEGETADQTEETADPEEETADQTKMTEDPEGETGTEDGTEDPSETAEATVTSEAAETTEDAGALEPETVMVTFLGLDSTIVETREVVSETAVGPLPEAPAVEGKEFDGWYDGDELFSATSVIEEDKEITAAYKDAETVFTFTGSTAYLKDIAAFYGISIANNSTLSVDNELIRLSATTAKNKNMDSITLTADGYFDHAALTIRKNKSIQTLELKYPDPNGDHGGQDETDAETDALVEGALYYNEHLYLTGKIPGNGIIDVAPVTVSIDGEKVLAAYDIKIYTNENQRKKGKTWQPAGKKVQVHFYDEAFAGEVNIYHISETKAAPEYVDTVTAQDGWVEFEADSFSTYAITQTIEKTVEIGGTTYHITVTYGKDAEIPDGAEIEAEEVAADADYLSYLNQTAEALQVDLSSITYSKLLDISIVKDGKKIEPKAPVDVKVELLDAEGVTDLRVVHFADDEQAVELSAETEGQTVTFETDGFSLFSLTDFTLIDHIFNAIFGNRKLYENDDIILSGKMPMLGSVEATPASVEIEGQKVLVAYDIKIYANPLMKLLGITWQPSGDYVHVTVKSDALEDGKMMTVYHMENITSEPELVTEVEAHDSSVSFDAKEFSIYPIVETKLTETVDASDGNTYEIEVTYKNTSGIPMEGTELLVAELMPGDEGYDEYVAASVEKMDVTPESIALSRVFDIKIVDENNHNTVYEPTGDVDVSIRLVGEALEEYTKLDVFHFVEDGNAEGFTVYDMDSTVDGETVQFTTDSFSVYVVDGTVPVRTYVFYTFNEYGEYTPYPFYSDSGKTVFNQIIKNGEKPVAPQNPTNPQDPNATFAGWYEDISEPGATDPVFAENAYNFDNIPVINEDEQVSLYAVFKSYAYVVFHDQYDPETGTFPVAYTVREELNDGSVEVDISSYRVIYHGSGNTMVFDGWSEVPITTPGAANNDLDEAVVKLADTIIVTGNKELYPIFTPAYWITFYSGYSGSGATYYPETYYLKGEGPDSLPNDVTRNVGSNGAYTFAGWYAGATLTGEEGKEEADITGAVQIANADGTLVADFTDTSDLGISVQNGKIVLTKDVTLYAAWTQTGTAEYSVIIWKQKASDAPGLADGDKSYDFADRAAETGLIGEPVSVDNEYITKSYSGFSYSRCDDAKTLAADGSTVLNVYYDRIDLSAIPTGSYTLIFADSVTNEAEQSASLPINYDGSTAGFDQISYGTDLSGSETEYVPEDPESGREGYSFTGWFADPACTIRAFFEADAVYNAYNGVKVLYATMPDQDVTVYAGWGEAKFLVNIDPNYGALYSYDGSGNLVGTGATYFNGSHTSTIQEYTTVTRDYVESSSGTWYYVKHDKAFYDAGNTVTGSDRYTYYTQNPSEATEFTTFAYEPGVYRYAGWYEVFNYGQDDEYESDTPYVFGQPVDHDTTIRLHWTKMDAYYISYDPGDGTLNDNEDQETFYVALDGETYADNAEVLITRIATPPDGYEFTGWQIRGDESGTVYQPGHSFTLLAQYAAMVQGKKTVYLDAVYTAVPTAAIVYHANGGEMDPDHIDYGSVESGSLNPVTSYDAGDGTGDGTVTVSNLTNNSRVFLSDGNVWLSMTDATFVGWCANAVYDPNDEAAPLLYAGTEYEYRVDTNDPNPTDLYAVWQVSVNYHLNQTDADWGGEWDSAVYTLRTSSGEEFYTQNLYLGNAVNSSGNGPEYVPVYTGSDDLMFLYWAARTGEEGSYTYTQYDFAQPVQGQLDLYAVWGSSINISVHAVDASGETLSEKSSWVTTAEMPVGASPVDLNETTANQYITLPNDKEYEFAFATLYAPSDSLQQMTDSGAAEKIYYDGLSGEIAVSHSDGSITTLAEGEELYFVFYEKKDLDIGYRIMANDGILTEKVVSGSAPVQAENLGVYAMADVITAPLAWLNDNTYPYYAFAIGCADATNVSALPYVTDASDSDSARPTLHVRNTWRGFKYSTDGAEWHSAGYDVQLYVLYYEKRVTVVTISEQTLGLASDMEQEFTFNYMIEESRDSGSTWTSVYNTADSGNAPFTLKNDESDSIILFGDANVVQRVTVTQSEETGFTTTGEDVTERVYTYTADTDNHDARSVTFINTRASIPVEAHVALLDITNGTITIQDNLRSGTEGEYRFDFALQNDQLVTFTERLSPDVLFTGGSEYKDYAFGNILFGTDAGTDSEAVTVGGMGVAAIGCALNGNVFEVRLLDSTGSTLLEGLDDYRIYYLYYPMPQIQYVEETAGGVLTLIQGSTDGSTASDDPTYDRASLTLNGEIVTQNQKFIIPAEGLKIAQTVGSFRMPPLLDKWDGEMLNQLYLVYSRIGVGDADKGSVSELADTSEDLTLYLRFGSNHLQWSFDGTDWHAFTDTPTIYAIYQERGYPLEITKTVPIDTGYTEPFTVTVRSNAINHTSYAVEGTGSSTVSAEIENGEGTITVQVTNGSVIKILGLGSGQYTVTESGNENHVLTVSQTYLEEDSSKTENLSVTNNAVAFTLDREKTLALTNTPKVICKVGTRYFHTIQSAVQWIEDNSATFSGTIEMLVDYLMPSSDAPVIPDYLDVTLTTAAEYGDGAATITRSGTFASGAMFTNSGTLTFRNITLDGNDDQVTASSAMIENEGTLTIADGASLQNAKSSTGGGAINSWEGSVTVSGGTVSGNTAMLGGAIYASGGDVTVSGGSVTNNSAQNGGAVYYTGTGAVTVSGGSITANEATRGGAVYLEKGTLTVSGGSIASNTASENGGAVYATNGEIAISGGTIGGSETGNSAQNGGAIYLKNGSVTVSGGSVSNNTASGKGGGICTEVGAVTVSGGSIASNTAAENGGGVYTASGAITVSGSSTAISNNEAENGGGLYSTGGAISVANATLSNNQATTGSGGGVYTDTGSVSLSSAKFTGNSADEGFGGGIYGNSSAITLTSCTFGGASGSGNSAVNGAAVYTNTGSATFSAGTVNYNTAKAGGAVGVGSSTARLYFSGNVKITDNTMSDSPSNVYLDQDSDAVINAGVGNTALGNSASIGVYVPDKDVTVTDISGATSTENLFDRRGVPGAFFATYTSTSNTGKFSNDRQPGLSVQQETSSKRLYWGKKFTVEVRYLDSFSGSLTTVAAGTVKNIDNKTSIDYYAPSSSNAASEIADDLRSSHKINGLSTSAVFAVAFVGEDRTFANYITDVNWDSANNRWSFVKRDGTEITGDKLVVYFSEPAYIQIENNTEHPLDISALTVLGQSAVNSDTATGYGYVFAVNGVIQNELKPITAADLTLQPGKNIKLLFPGGKNAAWTLNGHFDGASGDDIPYTLNGTANTLAAANASDFELTGQKTLNTNGGTYNIVFGGKSAICRIVTTAIDGVQDSEIAGQTDPDSDNQVEYTFSTLKDAVNFATNPNHPLTDATIEMLVDYLIPSTDVVNLPAGYNFAFSTATTGTYKYSEDPNARATISRDQGNLSSFITSVNGALVSGDYNTSLKVENLIFDGKDFGGTGIERGIIRTKACNVEICNADFRNCQAKYGGGIYVESVDKGSSNKTPYGSLKVSGCTFINCQSLQSTDKYGGGGIWTSMKDVTVENCQFISCYCVYQGGALFHYVGGDFESYTTITNCTFDGCSAGQAAGSVESGAKTVRVTGTAFRSSTSNAKNGGALNVWSGNSDAKNGEPTTDCWVYLTCCTFENCYALNGTGDKGNGGAMRSTARYNTITDCIFINNIGNNGGAINIYNSNAVDTVISGCTFTGCSARGQGGAIWCRSKTLTINGSTSIRNCMATNEGGGICYLKDATGSVLTINNALVDNCSSNTAAGGGIYSMAQTVTANGLTVTDCTTKTNGGGIYLYPKSSGEPRSAMLTDVVVQNCTAPGNGGGIYYQNGNMLTISGTSSEISGNTSGGMGGGIYTNAANVTLTGTTVSDNTATSHGGGVCQNANNDKGRLTVDSCTISGNTSGGKGGGTYTLAHMTIRNDTRITGNRLTTEVKDDAAGVYLQNGRYLTVGTAGATESDDSTVTGNLTNSGKTPSNLRLSQTGNATSNNSTNSVDVLCHLSGEFRVIDAFSKGTQFGVSEISSAANPIYTSGFSDIRHVFIADDDSLYGIIDRSDTSLRKIIWAGEPICKITDANGRLLYVDTAHEYPAVFDKLDVGSANDTSSTSAFSLLRNEQPQLYYADGTLYTGNTYQVKMLVENYTATKYITTNYFEGRNIILTTAGSADSQYPYQGRSGTRSTIIRGTGMGNNNFITGNVNLTLTNIVLDGGSESGVTANSKTSIITSSQSGVTVTLGRNSALQNAAVSGTSNGGAVYLKNASLVIEGGAIRNCSAYNGGAVYKEGTGTVTMTGGSITGCTARNNGGGICIQSGPTAANGNAFIMTGGSITRCTALNGGGVWINDSYSMSMSGGNISQNNATAAGGGIAVGGNKARLNFSGSAFVYSNTLNGNACNVQMNQSFAGTQNNPQNPWTIIHTSGLIRGATIGVYVPDNNSLYNNHGVEAKPFASYEGTPAGFNYFINDRNGLKGGLMEEQVVGIDMKVYWRQIYTLEVNLEVLSKAASDKERDIRFTVTLSGTVGGKQWNEVNKTYGDLDFRGGIATFTLNGSTKTTAMADLLPLGYGYTVTMEAADAAGFTVYPSLAQTGEMNISSQFLYTVSFRLAKDVVCKITDDTYGLLYYKRGEAYVEAVYDALVSAFNRVNMGGLYYKVGDAYIPYTSNEHRIEMLIPEYEMTEAAALNAGKTVYLTTADPNADDGFPYAGGSSTAVIKRGYTGASMITVNGDLAQGNITLDGNGTNYPVSVNGGIVNVNAGGSLTVGTGATLQNSTTSGDGAAVYLAEDSTMKISGAPAFENNVTTDAVSSGSTNGGTSDYYTGTAAKQDIFIAGYNSTDATSLHVTGNITSDQGSIAVWAEQALHFEQSKQFAVMDGGTYTGLNAFRNARTDTDTKNPQKGDPKYLYGVIRGSDGKVYWSGSMDLTITKTLAGDFADMTQTFEFTVSGLTAGDICAYTRYTSTDGTTWTAATGEGATGTLTANASGVLENISLGHHQKIVISIPCGTDVIVSETNGVYTASHTIGDSSSTTGNKTATITMNNDTTVAFTNTLKAVAPTGLSFAYAPFLLMAAVGVVLGLIVTTGHRRRKEEE